VTGGARKHTVKPGETLAGLAKRYYGDRSKWRVIFNANRDLIHDPDVLAVGWVLEIPAAE